MNIRTIGNGARVNKNISINVDGNIPNENLKFPPYENCKRISILG